MIKQFKIISIALFSAMLNTQCQNARTDKNFDLSNSAIQVDSCGVYYKGHRLELGTPIAEWEKVLGPPSRRFPAYHDKFNSGNSVWDDKGIAIDNFENGDNKVAEVYIFFINLDSPEGKAGQLNFARGWEEFTKEWKDNILNDKNDSFEERMRLVKKIEEEHSPKNFIYPFTTYKGYVNLHGFPVGAGMKVAEINSYRKGMTYSGEFGYVDDDIDGVNDSDNTTDTFGGDYRAFGTECRGNRLQYYELTYTATGALEYLKIRYESRNDFENRKDMEESQRKRMEKYSEK